MLSCPNASRLTFFIQQSEFSIQQFQRQSLASCRALLEEDGVRTERELRSTDDDAIFAAHDLANHGHLWVRPACLRSHRLSHTWRELHLLAGIQDETAYLAARSDKKGVHCPMNRLGLCRGRSRWWWRKHVSASVRCGWPSAAIERHAGSVRSTASPRTRWSTMWPFRIARECYGLTVDSYRVAIDTLAERRSAATASDHRYDVTLLDMACDRRPQAWADANLLASVEQQSSDGRPIVQQIRRHRSAHIDCPVPLLHGARPCDRYAERDGNDSGAEYDMWASDGHEHAPWSDLFMLV